MKRKLKYGGFSLLVTAIFLTGVVLLNVFAGLLTSRFFLKADLTPEGLYSITPEAEETLRNIREDIEVVVLSTQGEISQISNLMQQYSAVSGGRISYRYLDPNLNPALAEDYPGITEFSNLDIIVSSGRRSKSFNVSDMSTQTYDENMQQVDAFNADQLMVSALQYVLNEQVAKAVFVGGHEEADDASLRTLLTRYGYENADVNLGTEEIPEDTTLLIINAPLRDFMENEIEKLDVYMSGGGNAIVAYAYNAQGLSAFDGYLREWGVEVDNKLVLDYTNHYGYPFFLRALAAGNDKTPPSMAMFAEAGYYSGMMYGRPFRQVWPTGEQGQRAYSPIFTSYPTSYAKDNTEQMDDLEQAEGDEAGPFTVGSVTRQSQYDADSDLYYSYMVVLNAGLIESSILAEQTMFYNAGLTAALAIDLNPYSGEDIYIPAKAIDNRLLEITPSQTTVVMVLLIIVTPLLILGIGILTWRRRKNL